MAAANNIASTGIVVEVLTNDNYLDIEEGSLQTDIDMFHMAIKKGLWDEANEYITRQDDGVDIISQKSLSSSSKGWTSIHVAVDAGKFEIMKKLVEKGALLTEKDSEGYTPFALAVQSNDNHTVEWMLNEAGGNELLSMKINSDDDKGDIPVLLAATKGYKEMTTFVFSKTPWLTLLDNNCYYGAKLLSHCIHAEIFDVAATLLHHDGTQIPLTYKSDKCMRPIHALAHMGTGFMVGIKLNGYQRWIYNALQIPLDHEGKVITDESQRYQNGICNGLGITRLYRLKRDHYLVREILKCFCERIEKTSLKSELHEWSVHDAMLQAAKNGIIEFINSMRKANPNLLCAMDKNKRGIFAHAILNRQEEVLKFICEIDGKKGLKASIDIFENNLLHLAAELIPSPSSYSQHEYNAVVQMERELSRFKMIEHIVPPMYRKAKNVDGLEPRELFTKNHEQLLEEGRKWVKETSNLFTILGTLVITVMFAAFTGENNHSKGKPIVFGKDAHSFFIILSALALVASSAAVLMFINILTKRYSEEEFSSTLPFHLTSGVYLIYLSEVLVACAFYASLLSILEDNNLIIGIAISGLPILLFGTMMLIRLTKLFTCIPKNQ